VNTVKVRDAEHQVWLPRGARRPLRRTGSPPSHRLAAVARGDWQSHLSGGVWSRESLGDATESVRQPGGAPSSWRTSFVPSPPVDGVAQGVGLSHLPGGVWSRESLGDATGSV
jgi:hypothetical protein